jgi:hypothetical protein
MNLLEISQIILNFVLSIAVLLLIIIMGVALYFKLKFIRMVKRFFEDLSRESAQLHQRLDNFLNLLAKIPFLAGMLKQNKKTKTK